VGSSTVSEAAEISDLTPPAGSERVQVAWVGPRPEWLDGDIGSRALEGFSVAITASADSQVVHVVQPTAGLVAGVRSTHGSAVVVVDLGDVASATDDALCDAATADVVLVESSVEADRARMRLAELDGKLAIAPQPVDLDWHAPEDVLTRLPGGYIKRFRRLHRLAPPTVLFVGPYMPAGGLDLAIAATYRLRERLEDIRLAAIPLGTVDQEYLDECEMSALGLGHRGIVEWAPPRDEGRFWYATATVVCCPWREPAEPPEASLLAAAAARPFLGSDLAVFRDGFRPPHSPQLVRAGDVEALVAALEPLVADLPAADALGQAAREAAEALLSYEATAARLASLWRQALELRSHAETA
jgi:glycosyltransferase involved in cell wall biosynthesis